MAVLCSRCRRPVEDFTDGVVRKLVVWCTDCTIEDMVVHPNSAHAARDTIVIWAVGSLILVGGIVAVLVR